MGHVLDHRFLTPEEMEQKGLRKCRGCGGNIPKNNQWHVCPDRSKRTKAGHKTRKLASYAKLKADEQLLRAKQIALRKILLHQPNEFIAEEMDLPLHKIEAIQRSHAYKEVQAEWNAKVSEQEKAAFEHVEKKLIVAGDLASNRILEILREVEIDDKSLATLAKLSTDVLKMRGHEKPKEQKTQIEVSLSPDTLALMRSADAELDHVSTIVLDDSDFSYPVELESHEAPSSASLVGTPLQVTGPQEEREDPDDSEEFVEEQSE